MMMRALLVALAWLGGSLSVRGAEPDLSTPQKARRAYDAAMHAGDAAGAKAVAVYDAEWEKVIEVGAGADAAMAKLRTAAVGRWGDAASREFPVPRLDDIPEREYQVMGDREVLRFRQTVVRRFRRVEGKWKVVL